MKETPPLFCANCGAEIPRKALACPECGADERTGWREEQSLYDGLDLPDSAWEEDGADEGDPAAGGDSPPWYWIAVAFALIVGGLLFLFGLR